MLGQLLSLGLLPDHVVHVESQAPFHGPLLIRVGRSRYALGREVAAKIYVAQKRLAEPEGETTEELKAAPWVEVE